MTDTLCWTTRLRMAGLDDVDDLSGRRAEHAVTCLRCQAEAAKYRRLRRSLAALAGVVEPAPLGLSGSVNEALKGGSGAESTIGRLTGVAAAGAAAVVAAGTVVVLRRLRGAA